MDEEYDTNLSPHKNQLREERKGEGNFFTNSVRDPITANQAEQEASVQSAQ